MDNNKTHGLQARQTIEVGLADCLFGIFRLKLP